MILPVQVRGVVRMSWLIGRVLFATRPHDHAVGDHPSGTTVAGRLVRSTRTLGRAALERVREPEGSS
jgi:hypothetical protein